jgi:hypothetical protein
MHPLSRHTAILAIIDVSVTTDKVASPRPNRAQPIHIIFPSPGMEGSIRLIVNQTIDAGIGRPWKRVASP